MNPKRFILTCAAALISIPACALPVAHRVEFHPNTPAEKPYILKSQGSSILGTISRYAENGGYWIYRFPIPEGADCRVTVAVEGKGTISLSDGKSTVAKQVSAAKQTEQSIALRSRSDATQALLKIQSKSGDIRVQKVAFQYTDLDSNGNGVSDSVERLMGVEKSLIKSRNLAIVGLGDLHLLKVNPRPSEPHTSFQTPTGYMADNDIRTDSAIVYQSGKDAYDTWKARGYDTQTMYGFRTGDDYIKDHRDEGQTAANGEILTCGPGSYYMVPTKSRIQAALKYFSEAIDNGSTAVIPEEPEYFTIAGYSDSFKREWQATYNEPWQDPTTSIETRWKAGQLMGDMELRMVQSIMDLAKAKKPSVRRMVAAHSQISYYHGGIIFPHYKMLMLPSFQELVGQVWTGTARDGCKYEGVSAERTFEWGYLEYSSLYNLMRNSGKRVWFLMDPLEDNPDRSMEDYQENYEKTLIASMMFPGVDEYEVMPWPTRIYGRVPDWFSTKIGTIVGMLGDMHNQKDSEVDAGTQGIATFVADSMAWQRGEPNPSNYDTIYGMTLPLLMKGVPVQIAQLERSPEPKYLDAYKVLLVSYDMLKPMSPKYNTALANWVRNGGSLVIMGGNDPYNDLNEWWKAAGFATPQEHLLSELGLRPRKSAAIVGSNGSYVPIVSESENERNAANQKVYTIDLTDRVLPDGHVYVKFADSRPTDGWGAIVRNAKLIVNGQVTVSFDACTDEERKYIVDDNGSQMTGTARFADALSSWTYGFEVPVGAKVELAVDMANQYSVSVATEPVSAKTALHGKADNAFVAKYPELVIPRSSSITAYDVDATPLYSLDGSTLSPAFEATVGKGSVIFMGVAPTYFARSKESAEQIRSLVSYACSKAGVQYREQGYITVRRGRYLAIRSFETPVALKGSYVRVLDPGLKYEVDPVIPAGTWTVLTDVTSQISGAPHTSEAIRLASRTPRVLLSASRVDAKVEARGLTSVLVSGPLKTKGVTRISTAGRTLSSVGAFDTTGNKMALTQSAEGDTVALTYDNLPDGVVLKLTWK